MKTVDGTNVPSEWYYAIHEAAHAVVGKAQGFKIPCVSIVGGSRQAEYDARHLEEDRELARKLALFWLAGPAASDERLLGGVVGERHPGSQRDDEMALEALDGDARLFQALLGHVKHVVDECWPEIEAVAVVLVRVGTIAPFC